MNAVQDSRKSITYVLAAGFATHGFALNRGRSFGKAGADGPLQRQRQGRGRELAEKYAYLQQRVADRKELALFYKYLNL